MTDEPQVIVGSGPVLLTLQDGVAQIILNRPEASNGVSIDLLKALHAVILACHGDRRVRAVILRGAGRNFCAGGDVKEFESKGAALPDFLRQATAYLQISVSALVQLGAPVIVMVQGFAAGGGGLGLVCAGDLVVCAESAKFMAGGTRVGMAPDGGATVSLGRIVGFRRAMDLVLTNRILDAAEAERIGLVSRVAPDDALEEETLALARSLAQGAPRALATTKRLMWAGLGRSFEDCLPDEAREVSALSGTADSLEGLRAVIERRPPVFRGA